MIVAGIGFNGRATVASLLDALTRAGTGAEALATLDRKATDPRAQALAARLGLPLHGLAPDLIAAQDTPTRSPHSAALTGAGSLAEAAALALAGPGARLRGPRAFSADGTATAAIAERTTP